MSEIANMCIKTGADSWFGASKAVSSVYMLNLVFKT